MTVAQQAYVQDQTGVTRVLSLLAHVNCSLLKCIAVRLPLLLCRSLECCEVASTFAVQKP